MSWEEFKTLIYVIHYPTVRLIKMCFCVCLQGISVVEQEQLDNMMIEMDGTENKCESKQVVMT